MQPIASSSNAIAEDVQRRQQANAAASVVVNKAINEAFAWILSDPTEYFLYKYPRECEERPNNRLQLARHAAIEAYVKSTSAKERRNSVRAVTKTNERRRVDWLRIDEFSLHRLVQLVYDYLSLWRLTPSTHYMVRLEQNSMCEKAQGRSYSLSALFTRTPQPNLEHCNPLAAAQVVFKVHVSHLLPKFYPLMLTYRFENSNMDYYALGHRRMRRMDFQRFFIDMALETKLGLYAQLLKTLTLNISPKSVVKQRTRKRKDRKREEQTAPNFCICAAEESAPLTRESDSEKEQLENVSSIECVQIIDVDFGVRQSEDASKSAGMKPGGSNENTTENRSLADKEESELA